MSEKRPHLAIEEILALRAAPDFKGQVTDAEVHAATCPKCKALYDSVVGIEQAITRANPEKERGPGCPEEWVVAAFMAGEREGKEGQGVREHLACCPSCMDIAAEYIKASRDAETRFRVPDAWKNIAVNALAATPPIEKPARDVGEPGGIRRLLTRLYDILAPLPALPGYAVAAIALALLLWGHMGRDGKMIIMQNSERLAYTGGDDLGSMGFLGDRPAETVGNMEIRQHRGVFLMSWKPIEGATSYSFSLLERHTGREVMRLAGLTGPQAEITSAAISPNQTYGWVIDGQTGDGRHFEYTGDFVYAK